MPSINRTISIAPMMDWTDRHCRHFHRLISQQVLLYTEMITTGALLHGDQHRFLQFNRSEHPLALQLGGSEPDDLAQCAIMAEQFGYDEVNLNVGCPSDRVQSGRFGACLMAEPELVGNCIKQMQTSVSLPVTVKCRIGIDNQDSYPELVNFIETVAKNGCQTFIIHARKAFLSGLSPKQNRDVPPLRYDLVYQLKQDFPELDIILNGGIKTIDQIETHLEHCDGIMIGREAYHNPYLLADMDSLISGAALTPPSRHDVILALIPYIREQLHRQVRLSSISRHILGIFHGQPGARSWRRYISENAAKKDADESVILKALNFVKC